MLFLFLCCFCVCVGLCFRKYDSLWLSKLSKSITKNMTKKFWQSVFKWKVNLNVKSANKPEHKNKTPKFKRQTKGCEKMHLDHNNKKLAKTNSKESKTEMSKLCANFSKKKSSHLAKRVKGEPKIFGITGCQQTNKAQKQWPTKNRTLITVA